jgi:hypothetical protein
MSKHYLSIPPEQYSAIGDAKASSGINWEFWLCFICTIYK